MMERECQIGKHLLDGFQTRTGISTGIVSVQLCGECNDMRRSWMI